MRDTLAYKIAGKLSNQGLIRRSDIGKVRAGIEQMLFAESAQTTAQKSPQPVTPPQTTSTSQLAETPPCTALTKPVTREELKIATADEVYKRQQAIPSLRQPKNTMYQKRITVVTGFKPMSVDPPLDWRGVDFSDKRFRNYCCGYCECHMYDSAILKNMLWKHHPMFNTSYPMAELVSKMDAAHASSCAIHEYTLEYTKLHQFVHQIFRKIGVKDLGEMEAEAKRWLSTIIPYTPETFDERAESRRPSPKHFLGIVRGLDGTLGFRLPDAETFILGRRDPYSSPFLNGVWFERWPTEKELMCLIALKGSVNTFCFGIPNEFHKHGN